MRNEQVDKVLIKLINSGNETAFSILYEAYYIYLNAIAFYYLNDKEVSKEIVNDVFLKVWKKRETLIYPVHSYLVKVVQNSCIDFIRIQQSQERAYGSHREQLTRSYREEYISSTPPPLEYVEFQETEEEIRKAISQLTPRCQQIFKAYFDDGKSIEEIAVDLNITVSTVRVQMKNSYDKLRILLKHLLFSFF
ncbi:DNA-directed RNA polymerase sigma-70 factor [Bacteroidia bacterium]|nr:DNA-directed RNA polymerase sigma-70 factor [Bacteroidia bacterium]